MDRCNRRALFLWVIVLINIIVIAGNSDDIGNKLKRYQVLSSADISHNVVKREIGNAANNYNIIKELKFKALGRDFRLMLSPRKGILSSHFRAYSLDAMGKKELVWVDQENFYEGKVYGEKRSDISAHYENGVLTATIQMSDETYVIEPAWRHLRSSSNDTMIAYCGSDVIYSWEHDNYHKMKVCGYVKEGVNSSIEDEKIEIKDEDNERLKRRHTDNQFDIAKSRCPLLLVSDYRFYQNMGGRSEKSTINYLVSLVDRVHKIFVETEWSDRPKETGFKGMGFIIEEIHIHKEATDVSGQNQNHYNMETNDWNVRDLLEVFSREPSHRGFCLAHLFTDIKFEGGILGLAYVGSPRRNSVGGICTPEYFKNGYTLYLNSGLSSSRNHYGQRVITREADLVTAHEFGHNWGSEHDPDLQECSPEAKIGGSFLMYTYSVRGYDTNNKRFSPCSLRSIRAVLLAKSSKCFKEAQESFCGNSRVESGEECDVGLMSSEAEDDCCDRNCKLKRGQKCSDKNSPCCKNCHFVHSVMKCRDANTNTCEKETNCLSTSAECPQAPPEDDDNECIDKGKCKGGQCIPFCETMNLQSCMCDVVANSCKRCCRQLVNSTCMPVEPIEVLVDGTPCIHGFCNRGICDKTAQDIVERFWDIIEDININTVLKFLNDNIVGTVIIASAVLWIPASCVISYIDRKRVKQLRKEMEWRRREAVGMIHPENIKKVIHVKESAQRTSSCERSAINPTSLNTGRRTRFQNSVTAHVL